jgi:hypothetical protein
MSLISGRFDSTCTFLTLSFTQMFSVKSWVLNAYAVLLVLYIVEPVLSGHHRSGRKCPD